MSCQRTSLARCPIGMVERCACGSLHLTIGALSVRMDVEVLRAVVRMGGEALEGLAETSSGTKTHSHVRGRA